MLEKLKYSLLQRRGPDGFFESRLSDSAVSTAVACIALEIADPRVFAQNIRTAKEWLVTAQNEDGLYGDSPESPANLTATFLACVALDRTKSHADKTERAKAWLLERFGDFSFASVKKGFLSEYGKDLTFSVPILALATTAGFFEDAGHAWRNMPRFPFEVVLFPERLFRHLNLPVVSYAIPALICVGLAQLRHTNPGIVKKLRSFATSTALRVLAAKQPFSGGFLEAAPLTGFCAMCLCVAGFEDHHVTKSALKFLAETQRENGSWAIDRDLRQWTTSLSLVPLSRFMTAGEKRRYREALNLRQGNVEHPFTRSAPGGWAWTTHSGGVPDADDTSAALIALHHLGEPFGDSIRNGIEWLLGLQNRDGGIPTFCRGWGALPFDRSCPDISAHAFKAFSCYENEIPDRLRQRVAIGKKKILRYLEKTQRKDGSFVPLWFGDQTAPNKEAPVYGSAVVLEHLQGLDEPFLEATKNFLLASQHDSGGWSGGGDGPDCVTVTARCVSALASWPDTKTAVRRALEYLQPYGESPDSIPPEPIGLYFAHLWYSEELYPLIFLLNAFQEADEWGAGVVAKESSSRFVSLDGPVASG